MPAGVGSAVLLSFGHPDRDGGDVTDMEPRDQRVPNSAEGSRFNPVLFTIKLKAKECHGTSNGYCGPSRFNHLVSSNKGQDRITCQVIREVLGLGQGPGSCRAYRQPVGCGHGLAQRDPPVRAQSGFRWAQGVRNRMRELAARPDGVHQLAHDHFEQVLGKGLGACAAEGARALTELSASA